MKTKTNTKTNTKTKAKTATNGNGNGTVAATGENRRPAKLIARGDVRVRIWANPTPWGDIDWRVSFTRTYARPNGNGYGTSFDVHDLKDLIQGAFDARRWIARAERRLRRRAVSFLPWR